MRTWPGLSADWSDFSNQPLVIRHDRVSGERDNALDEGLGNEDANVAGLLLRVSCRDAGVIGDGLETLCDPTARKTARVRAKSGLAGKRIVAQICLPGFYWGVVAQKGSGL
jgi:hypothetical protein